MDLQTLLQEHEDLQGELRGSTDKAKRATCEVKDQLTQISQQGGRSDVPENCI